MDNRSSKRFIQNLRKTATCASHGSDKVKKKKKDKKDKKRKAMMAGYTKTASDGGPIIEQLRTMGPTHFGRTVLPTLGKALDVMSLGTITGALRQNGRNFVEDIVGTSEPALPKAQSLRKKTYDREVGKGKSPKQLPMTPSGTPKTTPSAANMRARANLQKNQSHNEKAMNANLDMYAAIMGNGIRHKSSVKPGEAPQRIENCIHNGNPDHPFSRVMTKESALTLFDHLRGSYAEKYAVDDDDDLQAIEDNRQATGENRMDIDTNARGVAGNRKGIVRAQGTADSNTNAITGNENFMGEIQKYLKGRGRSTGIGMGVGGGTAALLTHLLMDDPKILDYLQNTGIGSAVGGVVGSQVGGVPKAAAEDVKPVAKFRPNSPSITQTPLAPTPLGRTQISAAHLPMQGRTLPQAVKPAVKPGMAQAKARSAAKPATKTPAKPGMAQAKARTSGK